MSEDGRLLRQYREQGSQAAFARLAARHLGLVYATCLRETGDAAQAEDAAQVVFLLLARRPPCAPSSRCLSGCSKPPASLRKTPAAAKPAAKSGRNAP